MARVTGLSLQDQRNRQDSAMMGARANGATESGGVARGRRINEIAEVYEWGGAESSVDPSTAPR
jgi:hypothetical protein